MFNLSYLFLVISIDLPLCYTKAYMLINQNTLYTLTIGNPKCPQTRLIKHSQCIKLLIFILCCNFIEYLKDTNSFP